MRFFCNFAHYEKKPHTSAHLHTAIYFVRDMSVVSWEEQRHQPHDRPTGGVGR